MDSRRGRAYHDFHLAWIAELRKALNRGLLPAGYYAQAEQRADEVIPDVLALHESDPLITELPEPEGDGVATLTKARPAAQERLIAEVPVRGKRRTLTIRSNAGHRIIAFVEIVSPSNKDRVDSVSDFTGKVIAALVTGIHVLMLASDTVASYLAAKPVQDFVNRLDIGDPLPDMPLFLTRTKYVDVPFESTYMAAYSGMPDFWRKVIEAKPA